MDLRISDIKALKAELKKLDLYGGDITGQANKTTVGGAASFLAHEDLLPEDYKGWSRKQTVTACYQVI